MSMPRWLRWRWVLPVIVLAVSAALIWGGEVERRHRFAAIHSEWITEHSAGHLDWQKAAAWEYTPGAHQAVGMINFPVLVLALPFVGLVNSGWAAMAITAALGVLFWAWIGRQLDRKTGNLPPRPPVEPVPALIVNTLGVAVALLSAIFVFDMRGVSKLFIAAGFAWSVAFLVFFGRRLWAARPRRA